MRFLGLKKNRVLHVVGVDCMALLGVNMLGRLQFQGVGGVQVRLETLADGGFKDAAQLLHAPAHAVDGTVEGCRVAVGVLALRCTCILGSCSG